jgi:hypothetical protein
VLLAGRPLALESLPASGDPVRKAKGGPRDFFCSGGFRPSMRLLYRVTSHASSISMSQHNIGIPDQLSWKKQAPPGGCPRLTLSVQDWQLPLVNPHGWHRFEHLDDLLDDLQLGNQTLSLETAE